MSLLSVRNMVSVSLVTSISEEHGLCHSLVTSIGEEHGLCHSIVTSIGEEHGHLCCLCQSLLFAIKVPCLC